MPIGTNLCQMNVNMLKLKQLIELHTGSIDLKWKKNHDNESMKQVIFSIYKSGFLIIIIDLHTYLYTYLLLWKKQHWSNFHLTFCQKECTKMPIWLDSRFDLRSDNNFM